MEEEEWSSLSSAEPVSIGGLLAFDNSVALEVDDIVCDR